MKSYTILIGCLMIALMEREAAAGQPPIEIVRDGKPAASIVIADKAPEKVLRAVRDLQETIREATGAEAPVAPEKCRPAGSRLLVGDSASARSLGVAGPKGTGSRDEAIILRYVGSDFVIAGNDDDPYRRTQDAVFRYVAGEVDSAPLAEFERWNHYGGTAIEHRHIHAGIAPPEVYFKIHPKYYSEIWGKRSATEPEGWQLCTTNPDVVRLAVERSRRILSESPGLQAVSFFNNDRAGKCACAECRKLDAPDPVSGEGPLHGRLR
ncbi:MAG: DUF4838 domain-containing protein [Armatimonadetes bacterium]|nr:DUF4838 domain-containing protein [Armatimonadota bacterium]